MKQTTTTNKSKKTPPKAKGNGKANLSEDIRVKFEKLSEELPDFQKMQKKMDDFVENYSGKIQKLREEVEARTNESFSQIASRLRFATRDDVENISKKLEKLDRKLNKIIRAISK